jgi:hypothetical protein
VTCYPRRDDNDFWVVEAVNGPLVPLEFSNHEGALRWLSVVHLAASIASISGITLLFLGTTLKSVTLAKLLATVFATSLVIGIASLVFLLLLRIHRSLKLRLWHGLSVPAMWMTGGALAFAVVVFLWWATFKYAAPLLQTTLEELFG